jgi:hypothetical protein
MSIFLNRAQKLGRDGSNDFSPSELQYSRELMRQSVRLRLIAAHSDQGSIPLTPRGGRVAAL